MTPVTFAITEAPTVSSLLLELDVVTVVEVNIFDFLGGVVVNVLGVDECFVLNGCRVDCPLIHGTVEVKAFVRLISGTSVEDVTTK